MFEQWLCNSCKQPDLLSSDRGTMLHCKYTDQTALSPVHPQVMFVFIPKPHLSPSSKPQPDLCPGLHNQLQHQGFLELAQSRL